jgi:AcrR family transcriptional regulator
LQAAREVFTEMGFEAATFQEIATRADLTRPAINHYYPTKQALYQHVVTETRGVVISAGVREAEGEHTFAGRLEAFVRAAVQPADSDRSAAAFLVTSVLDAQRNPELERDASSPLQHMRDFATTAVRHGIANGELRDDLDVEAAAEMLMATLWGLGFYAGFVDDQDKLVSITAQFVGLLDGHGWKPTG